MANYILIFAMAVWKLILKFHMKNNYISFLSESLFLCIILTPQINFCLLSQVSLEKRQK